MGWFRTDDQASDHPKFVALSDGAFRLWFESRCYCNRFLTDGLVLLAVLTGFRYYTQKRVDELVNNRLWEVEHDGFRLHDFADWNDSSDTVKQKREAARSRMRKRRSVDDVPEKFARTHDERSQNVPSLVSSSSISVLPDRRKDDPFLDSGITERAGRFVERYEAMYSQHRKARYLVRPQRDYMSAVELCRTWTDDGRLDKLAAIFLTTDHQFAASGARNITQFASLASWCDGQLAAWEATKGAAR